MKACGWQQALDCVRGCKATERWVFATVLLKLLGEASLEKGGVISELTSKASFQASAQSTTAPDATVPSPASQLSVSGVERRCS